MAGKKWVLFKTQCGPWTPFYALSAGQAMAVIDRISQPCVPAHIDSHRAMVSADTALDAAKSISNDITADERLAAIGARFDPILYVHIFC